MSGRNAVIENASNRQTPFLERRWLVGLLIPRLAIYYGLLKLECRSWNVADWTRVIQRLRSVNGTPFNQNAVYQCKTFKLRVRSTLLRRGANKRRSPFFSTVRRYSSNGNFSMTPTVCAYVLCMCICVYVYLTLTLWGP